MPGIAAGDHIRAPLISATLDRYVATDRTTTFVNGEEKDLTWADAQTRSPNIATNIDNTIFTFERAGIYIVEFLIRVQYVTGPTTGDLYGFVRKNFTTELCGQTEAAPITSAFSPLIQAKTMDSFGEGDQIEIRLRNLTNQTCTMWSLADLCHVSFLWLQSQ